nr:MAG TPA: Oxaloacetate decarboxylase, gamma chain [Caudoviricetes sp.]
MTISNFCVVFVVFIVLLVITGIIGWFFMWMTDEENLFMIFSAWFISTIGLATCLTYILVMKGFI